MSNILRFGSARRTQTVVIGAGHTGLAISHRLSNLDIDHVVLERGDVGERWHNERWDSLSLLTPNWMFRLPGDGVLAPELGRLDPNGFMPKRDVAALLGLYARRSGAPLCSQTEVLSVVPTDMGYRVRTTAGDWLTSTVVVAAGGCDHTALPALASHLPRHIHQVPAHEYRRPEQVPDGGVIVVGASATGLQLADELNRAGRRTTLCVGDHVRMPRCYNTRDIYWWLDRIGLLAERYDEVDDIVRARRLPSPQLVGRATQALNLSTLKQQGVELIGRLAGLNGTRLQFSGSLANLCRSADLKAKRLLRRCDEFAADHGIELNETADDLAPTEIGSPRTQIDLASGEIRSVVWATGFRPSFGFLPDTAFDRKGRIVHDGGVMSLPGLYVLGLNLLRTRASSFIYGANQDSEHVARSIDAYLDQAVGRRRCS